MAFHSENPSWVSVYRRERTDLVDAGVDGLGPYNTPIIHLVQRTGWLKDSVDSLTSGLVLGSTVQPWDADLSAIAAISATNIYIRRSAANTWDTVKADIGCRCTRTASQSVPNNTSTAIAFNSELYDTDDIHDNSTNPSRLVCKTAGKYAIGGTLNFSADSNGLRQIQIRRNGGNLIAVQRVGSVNTSGPSHALSVSTVFNLAINDYVELEGFQNSGSSLSIDLIADYSPAFWMQRLL